MPTLTEKIDSREWTTGENKAVILHYVLEGTSNDLTAKALLLSSTAENYDGLIRDDCTLDPIFVDTVTGQGKWDCTVRYVKAEDIPPEVGELFLNLAEARYVVDRWRMDYNHHRPHSRLNWMTPAVYTASYPRTGRPCVPPGSATPHPPEHTENALA